SEAIPIRRGALVNRQEQIENKHRQTKPHQEQHFELLIHSAPTGDNSPDQRQKQQRRIHDKVLSQKREHLSWMKSEAALKTPARAQVRQRDPGVLRVPDNRRNCANNEQSDQQIYAGPFEFAS